MEFKSGSIDQKPNSQDFLGFKDTSLSSSGGETYFDSNHVIDLTLNDELPKEDRLEVAVESTVNSVDIEPIETLWAKARSRLSCGMTPGGWYYPIENKAEEILVEDQQVEAGSKESSLEVDVTRLLTETLAVFTTNAEAFRDHLGEMRREVQTLPLFQGALKSINTSVVGQSDEIKDLKSVCDFGLATLIDKQKEVQSEILNVKKILEQDSKSLLASTLNSDSSKDLGTLIRKISATEIEALQRIEAGLKSIDLTRFQNSFETIYKISKKGIDENREISSILTKSLDELLSRPIFEATGVSEESISNLQEEVRLHLDAILRIERKFENLKSKMILGYSFAMGVLGILLGSCLNFF